MSFQRWTAMTNDVISNLSVNDKTGFSVDIAPALTLENTTVIVGHPYYSTNTLANVGAVSVYRYNTTTTSWDAYGSKLYGTEAEQLFGYSVCMNSDSACFAVGAPGTTNITTSDTTGAVFGYIWDNGSNDWTLINPILYGFEDGSQFGRTVAGSRNAKTALISAPYEANATIQNAGCVRRYKYKQGGGGSWEKDTEWGDVYGTHANERWGWSLAANSNDKRVIIGSPYSINPSNSLMTGKAFHYHKHGSGYEVDDEIYGTYANEGVGSSVSISIDGNNFAVGAVNLTTNNGYVRVFKDKNSNGDGEEFEQLGANLTGLQVNDGFGSSIALANGVNRIVVGAPLYDSSSETNVGYMKVMDYDAVSDTWKQFRNVIYGLQENQKFGSAVTTVLDGTRIGAGAPGNSYAQYYYLRQFSQNIICFVSKTPIMTPNGIKQIDDIQKGDTVTTYEGKTDVVVKKISFTSPIPPYELKAHAIKRNMPMRDVLLSPRHRVWYPKKTRNQRRYGWYEIRNFHMATQLPQNDSDLYEYHHILLENRSDINLFGLKVETLQSSRAFNI